ncbi:LytTR family DNA-binding domain-containing protein [Eubacterium sp. MSJ-13]|uniref:LytR/AlgR family response regulator transcription factor n=1 Tax=Eubacterium sp. MSJ-13 TaxID=2841513 RepID=UPI001C0FC8F6|nr:LytTR family DNA-binding domain-containing protein [Eubacterium sp. MSJ-13]MBU5479116.1 LytTR family DNA-binding domain-containing protein [Eubacterium sp. MSJ-13]
MSVRIAICDDEHEICAVLEELLIKILEAKGINYEIEPFYSGKTLCNELKVQRYDLIFLDIEMKEKDGIETGNFIREELGDESVQIAYISSKTAYAMELFEFHPINFLTKPLEQSKVEKVIDKYLAITGQKNEFFEYKKKTEFFKIQMSEIIYFESRGRKISVKMMNGQDEFYGSMDDIYSRVKSNQFLYIHKSVIVNYRKIKQLSYEKVIMIDDAVFSISQSRRPAIRQMCLKIRKGER